MQPTLDELIAEVRKRLVDLGFELVDLRRGGTAQRVRLQVRVDRADTVPGHGVTVEDCATVSRALETWLDATGLIGPRYVLEVSSPGIERPIRWPEHWARFVGHDVHVRLPGRGRTRATIVAVAPDTGTVTLQPAASGEDQVTVPLAEARDATLAVDWDGSSLHPRDGRRTTQDGDGGR